VVAIVRSAMPLFLGVCVALLSVVACDSPETSPLRDYISAPDGAFAWEEVSRDDLVGGATLRRLELVSQVWQSAEWRHRIDVVVPQHIESNPTQVLLVVAGDAGDDGFLTYAGLIASRIGAPAAVLYDVPNQPLLGGLREDALIAESFARYLEDEDEKMPMLLPMVKSAVRAMDVIEQLVEVDLGMHVSGFVVTGDSKRGWTTWLAAAVDDRVSAIAPLAYDNLNMSAQMQHQLDTWGAFSSQVSDYSRRDIPQLLLSGEDPARRLEAMVDPYAYREGIVVPKLIVSGTNDAYWPLDAGGLYLDDLEGETFMLHVPNAGHGLESGIERVVGGLLALFLYADGRIDLPILGWEVREGDGDVLVSLTSDLEPVAVRAWTATSRTGDFRGSNWAAVDMVFDDEAFGHRLSVPGDRRLAIFGEAEYELDGGGTFFLSTRISMLGGIEVPD
jgi:PhoPQ-activated pathogenicity-related protein